jgi:hypothetical protein
MRRIMVLAALAGAVAAAVPTSATSQWTGEYRISRHDADRAFTVSVRGAVWFTDDDRDIAQLEEGGRLIVEERRPGVPERMLIVFRDGDGRLQRTYLEDSRPADYDRAAAEWFAGLLPEVIRESGVGAEQRARRILAHRGARGLIAEAERIHSSSARRRYLSVAFEEGRLGAVNAARAVRAIEPISSSSEKGILLRLAAERVSLDDPATRVAYFGAARSLSSSSELRRVLAAGVVESSLPEPVLLEALCASRNISSNSDRAAVLTGIARQHPLSNEALREAFFSSADGISSSSERRKVLVALLQAQGGSEAIVRDVVRSARTINSASEKSAVLMEAASRSGPPS